MWPFAGDSVFSSSMLQVTVGALAHDEALDIGTFPRALVRQQARIAQISEVLTPQSAWVDLDPRSMFRRGQGAPTKSYSRYFEEAQRSPRRKRPAQRGQRRRTVGLRAHLRSNVGAA
jgi:hypothetical protein